MLCRRSAVLILSSLLVLGGGDALGQRRAPPWKGKGKGRDKHDRGDKGKRRKPPSADRGWKVRKPPRIKHFRPTMGPPGTVVTIRGKFFDENTRVRFNGRQLRVISFDFKHLQVRIPRRAASDSFVVSKAGFQDVVSDARFEVIRPPIIKRFRPPRGDPGISIRIRGRNFISTDTAVIGKLPLKITSCEPRRIVATLPPNAVSGRIGIVRNGKVIAWSGQPFIVSLPPPVVRSFSPQSGPPGTLVQIHGANFDARDVVQLAGKRLPIRRRGPQHDRGRRPRPPQRALCRPWRRRPAGGLARQLRRGATAADRRVFDVAGRLSVRVDDVEAVGDGDPGALPAFGLAHVPKVGRGERTT